MVSPNFPLTQLKNFKDDLLVLTQAANPLVGRTRTFLCSALSFPPLLFPHSLLPRPHSTRAGPKLLYTQTEGMAAAAVEVPQPAIRTTTSTKTCHGLPKKVLLLGKGRGGERERRRRKWRKRTHQFNQQQQQKDEEREKNPVAS